MGSHWTLSVKKKPLLTGKNYLWDQVMLLFVDAERRMDQARYALLEQSWEADMPTPQRASAHLFTYRASVATLRARLGLQGFAFKDVRASALDYLEAQQRTEEGYSPWEDAGLRRTYNDPRRLLDATLDWRQQATYWRRLGDETVEDRYVSAAWDDLVDGFDDPRFSLALLLGPHRGNAVALLDLTDLLLGGWLEADELPHVTAQERLAGEVTASGPVIVVTEGSTDARFLRHALRLAEPGLVDAFAFLDFEGTSTPGGADRVVSLVRGMAAARVMNRVIAVLDNDTAGRVAERLLRKGQLPPHMTVTRLPDVPYGDRYPADGPDGRQLSRVNGRAAAIELMFGTDVLRAADDGELVPVRWTGYVSGEKDYQGELSAKGQVQDRLVALLAECKRLEDLESQCAAGCRLLTRMLLRSAAKATPSMATQYSSLLGHRARDRHLPASQGGTD